MRIYLQGLTMGLAYVAPIGLQNLFVINSALTQKRSRVYLTALIVIFWDISLGVACFLGAGALIMRAGSRNLADLRGLGRHMPWTVACMAVGLVSIMGLPPFGAFYSKFLMIQAAVDAGQIWLAALILAASLVGAVYYTRILKTLIFEKRPDHLPQVEEAPFSMRLSLLVLAAVSLLLGLFPQAVMPLVLPVASLCYPPWTFPRSSRP